MHTQAGEALQPVNVGFAEQACSGSPQLRRCSLNGPPPGKPKYDPDLALELKQPKNPL